MFIELFKWVLSVAKMAVIALGSIVILVILELMVKYKLITMPIWSDNILDNVFYFAYDWEKFGFLSIVTRWTITALVVWKIYDLCAIAYHYFIDKSKQP